MTTYQHGVQTANEFAMEMRNRALPWTVDDYERVRQAALELVRTHASWNAPDGSIRPTFNGSAYWALLGALDRSGKQEGQ